MPLLTPARFSILYAQGSKKDQAPNVYVLAKMTAAK